MLDDFKEELRYLERLMMEGERDHSRLPAWEAAYRRCLKELFDECYRLNRGKKIVYIHVYTLGEEALRILREIYR